MQTASFLKRLSEASGISGYEDRVCDLVREEYQQYADDIRVDAMGSLVALKRGRRGKDTPERRVMIAAHMDEIGLMVKQIEESFIRFTTVGGFDLRTLVGQNVTVHGTRDLEGVIGIRPPHLVPRSERKAVVPLDSLFIDVGLPGNELASCVRVGDTVSLRREFIELQGDYVAGKAFDDRAGVVAGAHCLEELTRLSHQWDAYIVASVQEEVGLRGAITCTFAVEPHIGVATDVGYGKMPDLLDAETIGLDKGPAIALGPNVHPLVRKRLVDVAKSEEIPYQNEPVPGPSGTDAWAIQVAREGIPTALLSVPLRYMHTTVETLCLNDIRRTGRLLGRFVASLDEEFAASLAV